MKLVSLIRGAAASAIVLLGAGVAQAQEAFSVSPDSGAIGETITLRSDAAFGTRRGKVTLALGAVKRRVPSARIVSWSADEVVFTIHRAVAGAQDITVKPRGRGAAALTSTNALEVLGPQLSGRNGNRFFKGDTLTLSGQNFGTVRGKVGLTPAQTSKRGTRRPRVTSWTNTTIDVKLPSLGPDGDYDITVTNFAGETQGMSPIELVTPPRPIRGGDRVVGKVGGRFNAANAAPTDQAYWEPSVGTSLFILGNDNRIGVGGATLRNLSITIDPGAAVGEIEFPAVLTRSAVAIITYSKSVTRGLGEARLTNYALDKDKDYQVRIDNIIDGRMSGTFRATLVKTGDNPGPGPEVLRISGSFVVGRVVQN